MGGGDEVNQEDVPENTCTRAKNRVRSYHRFRSAQHNSLRRPMCQIPGRWGHRENSI